jgi:hypothetical protein
MKMARMARTVAPRTPMIMPATSPEPTPSSCEEEVEEESAAEEDDEEADEEEVRMAEVGVALEVVSAVPVRVAVETAPLAPLVRSEGTRSVLLLQNREAVSTASMKEQRERTNRR